MFYTVIYPLTKFEFIGLFFFRSVFNRQYIYFFPKIGLYVILSLVFIMILSIFIENFNWLVSNNWSIYQESMYALIWKGLLIHGLKLFSVLVTSGCSFALLPFLVGWRCNYLDFSLQVVKFKTKFCSSSNFSSSSGVYYCFIKLHKWRNRVTLDIVGNLNAHTARNYYTSCVTRCRDKEKNYNSNLKMNPWFLTGFTDGEGCFFC